MTSYRSISTEAARDLAITLADQAVTSQLGDPQEASESTPPEETEIVAMISTSRYSLDFYYKIIIDTRAAKVSIVGRS